MIQNFVSIRREINGMLSYWVASVCEWHEEYNQELINNVWSTNEVPIYTLHREDEKKFAS